MELSLVLVGEGVKLILAHDQEEQWQRVQPALLITVHHSKEQQSQGLDTWLPGQVCSELPKVPGNSFTPPVPCPGWEVTQESHRAPKQALHGVNLELWGLPRSGS